MSKHDNEPRSKRMGKQTGIWFSKGDLILIQKIKETYRLESTGAVIRLAIAVLVTGIMPDQRITLSGRTIRKALDILAAEEDEKSKGRT